MAQAKSSTSQHRKKGIEPKINHRSQKPIGPIRILIRNSYLNVLQINIDLIKYKKWKVKTNLLDKVQIINKNFKFLERI